MSVCGTAGVLFLRFTNCARRALRENTGNLIRDISNVSAVDVVNSGFLFD